TATKLFLTTTLITPGGCLPFQPSTLTSLESSVGGRTTRACTRPGIRTSCVYVNAPVALPATSGRGTDVPTILYWSNDFGTALPVIARSKRLSPISCAYDTVFVESPLTETIPSLTVSCATGAPSCFDAIVSSARRASAAAWRIAPVGAYSVLFDWLPAVNPWSTHCHASPSTTVTD